MDQHIKLVAVQRYYTGRNQRNTVITTCIGPAVVMMCYLIKSYHDLRDQNWQIVGCQSALFVGGRILDMIMSELVNNDGAAGEQRCISAWSWFQCSVTALWGISVTPSSKHTSDYQIVMMIDGTSSCPIMIYMIKIDNLLVVCWRQDPS